MERKALISEAKDRVLEITKEIAALIDEKACLRIMLAQEEYISNTWRKRLSHRMAQRRYEANKKPRKDMLKAVMDG